MAITAAETLQVSYKGSTLTVSESKLGTKRIFHVSFDYFWKNPERPFCQTYIHRRRNALRKRNTAQMK